MYKLLFLILKALYVVNKTAWMYSDAQNTIRRFLFHFLDWKSKKQKIPAHLLPIFKKYQICDICEQDLDELKRSAAYDRNGRPLSHPDDNLVFAALDYLDACYSELNDVEYALINGVDESDSYWFSDYWWFERRDDDGFDWCLENERDECEKKIANGCALLQQAEKCHKFLKESDAYVQQLYDLKGTVIEKLGIEPAGCYKFKNDSKNYYLLYDLETFKFFRPVSKEWLHEHAGDKITVSETEDIVNTELSSEEEKSMDLPDIVAAIHILLDWLGLSEDQVDSFFDGSKASDLCEVTLPPVEYKRT